MKLLALPRYGRLGASSRLRVNQYVPIFQEAGMVVQIHALLDDDYVRAFYAREHVLASVLKGYRSRFAALWSAADFDVVFLEKEALPWLPEFLERALLRSCAKLVVDYDDAVFHRYDQHSSPLVRRFLGRKLDRLMRRADLVIVGNDYLGERARAAGSRWVEWVPTVVDLARYPVRQWADGQGRPVVVGWIGSPATAGYLADVVPALQRVALRHAIRCVAIGARADQVAGSPFEAWSWSEADEVDMLQRLDIGIMPLPDSPWTRGKCGYKLIQYMACGIPVVTSPVGANRQIVVDGESGFLANGVEAWSERLSQLVEDVALRQRMGIAGRRRVETTYCLQVQGPRMVELLRQVSAI